MADTQLAHDVLGGRYVLREKLGEGGMGIVYRATDRLTGETVALKRVTTPTMLLRFASRAADDPADTMRLSLTREFRTLATLRHPNIISVIDYGFDAERQPYFTMQYLENAQTLLEAAEGVALNERVTMIIQVLEALAYLHQRGVLHRDLKPDNVLVKQGQVRLLDFGLSVPPGESFGATGTLSYMAPEAMNEGPITRASDLYAVGVMAYQLFTGKHPFESSSLVKTMTAILTQPADLRELEHTPALAAVVGRLLLKTPEARYGTAQETMIAFWQAIRQPIPPETSAIRESFLQGARFVGREKELEKLQQALTNAREGRGSSWLIGGESGIGKSRLLDELRIRALVEGMQVLRGQGVAGGGRPYELWREPVRRLLLSAAVSDLDAGILSEIVPDIERVMGRVIPTPIRLEGEAAQKRLSAAIANLFRMLPQPAVLILEDLHWASESLEVLKQINLIVATLPLIVIGSYRDDERPDLPSSLTDMKLMRLERLDSGEMAELSVSILGESGSKNEMLALLQRETEGNAFFVVEVVRALAEQTGRLRNIGQTSLPEHVFAQGIQSIVEQRLAHVPQSAHPLLRLAAASGRQIDPALLQFLEPATNFNVWLNECANGAVLDVHEGEWRFAHDKLREGVLGQSSETERSKLHRRIARAIEQVYPSDVDRAAMLASHWRIAQDRAKERHYATLAGQQAMRYGAFRDARTHFERVLAITPTRDAAGRAFALVNLAKAEARLGDYASAGTRLEKGQRLATNLPDQRIAVEMLSWLGWVQWRGSQFDAARGNLEESIRRARSIDDKTGLGLALNHLGMVAWRQGNYAEAETHLSEALDYYRALEDNGGIASTISGLGVIAGEQNKDEECIQYYEQALNIYREIGDRLGVAMNLANLARRFTMRKDFKKARGSYEESLAVMRDLGHRWGMGACLNGLGGVAIAQEKFEEAKPYYEEAHSLFRQANDPMAIAVCLTRLGQIAAGLDQPEEAFQRFVDALRITHERQAHPITLDALTGFAALHSLKYHTLKVVEWAAMILAHPAASAEIRQRAQQLIDAARETHPSSEIEAALDKGRDSILSDVITSILAEANDLVLNQSP